jgi:predicted RNase H-like HicB family nuclease
MSVALPITAKISFDKSSKDAPFVAYCPELDVSSCGKTEEKAREMLREAIEIVLEEATKAGTLNKYLESVGYAKNGRRMSLPKISFEPLYFRIPESLASQLQWLA